MGFFTDFFTMGGDTRKTSSLSGQQNKLFQAMLEQAQGNFQNFKPFGGPTTPPRSPLGKGVVGAAQAGVGRGQRPPSQGAQRGREVLERSAGGGGGGGGAPQGSDSLAEIVQTGNATMLKKILAAVSGGGSPSQPRARA